MVRKSTRRTEYCMTTLNPSRRTSVKSYQYGTVSFSVMYVYLNIASTAELSHH